MSAEHGAQPDARHNRVRRFAPSDQRTWVHAQGKSPAI